MKIVLGAAAALFVILIAGLYIIGPNHEPLTELYFEDHQNLPRYLPTNKATPFVEETRVGKNIATYHSGVIITEYAGVPKILPEKQYPFNFTIQTNEATIVYYYNLGYTYSLEKPRAQTLNYPIAFTIRNLEGKPMTYQYAVTAMYNDKTVQITNGITKLQDTQSQTINTKFSIREPFGRAQITVEIPAKQQKIHFWVEEK